MRSGFLKLSGIALIAVIIALGSAQIGTLAQATQDATMQATAEASMAATLTCPQLPVATMEATMEASGTAMATEEKTPEPTKASDKPAYLGIAATNSEDGCGVLVTDIDPEGPANKVLELNDMIIGVDGKELRTRELLRDYIMEQTPGATVKVAFVRNNEVMEQEITLIERPVMATPTVTAATAEPTVEPTAAG